MNTYLASRRSCGGGCFVYPDPLVDGTGGQDAAPGLVDNCLAVAVAAVFAGDRDAGWAFAPPYPVIGHG